MLNRFDRRRHNADGAAGGAGPTTPAAASGAPATSGAPSQTDQASPAQGDEAPGKTYTQAELDRAVTAAIKAREKHVVAEQQRKHAEETQNYKTLYETAQAEKDALALRADTRDMLHEQGLGELAQVFDADLGTLDGRKAATKAITKMIAARVDAAIKERLKSAPPPSSDSAAPPKSVATMTPDEYKAWRATQGIR